MENFVFPDNLQGMLIFVKWHKMAISLNIQLCKMCTFQTEMADKVLKQSAWNQLQEQLQELSFQERYCAFLSDLPLDCLLWQTKGCLAWYLKSRGL